MRRASLAYVLPSFHDVASDAHARDRETGLDRVIETELRLEAELAEVKAEAARRLEAARAAALEADARAAERLAEEVAQIRRRTEGETETALATVAEKGRAELTSFRSLSPERIDELADYVVRRVIG